MQWPNLKAPSRGVWIATFLLCAVLGLIYWMGIDPVSVMAVVGAVLLVLGGASPRVSARKIDMRRAVVSAVCAGLLLAIAGSVPAKASYWSHCGDTIKAHGLSCRKARGVGLAYLRGLERFVSSPKPKGFSCQSRKVSPKPVFHVSCRRERGRRLEQVRFFYGWEAGGAR